MYPPWHDVSVALVHTIEVLRFSGFPRPISDLNGFVMRGPSTRRVN